MTEMDNEVHRSSLVRSLAYGPKVPDTNAKSPKTVQTAQQTFRTLVLNELPRSRIRDINVGLPGEDWLATPSQPLVRSTPGSEPSITSASGPVKLSLRSGCDRSGAPVSS